MLFAHWCLSTQPILNSTVPWLRTPQDLITSHIVRVVMNKKEPASNYRPISLLPIISKVLERCVCNPVYDHVHELINKAQHGFLHGRSCVTQLLTTLHYVGQLLNNNVQTDAIFLDFAKAFDSVDYIILLKKLKSYGISGNMYNWFIDYLHGRKQRVVVNGIASGLKLPLVFLRAVS